jgi:hypothetical protein
MSDEDWLNVRSLLCFVVGFSWWVHHLYIHICTSDVDLQLHCHTKNICGSHLPETDDLLLVTSCEQILWWTVGAGDYSGGHIHVVSNLYLKKHLCSSCICLVRIFTLHGGVLVGVILQCPIRTVADVRRGSVFIGLCCLANLWLSSLVSWIRHVLFFPEIILILWVVCSWYNSFQYWLKVICVFCIFFCCCGF